MPQETLTGYESNLKIIFENISESVLLTDRKGIILSFNGRTRQHVSRNLNKELRTGTSIFDYIADSRRSYFETIMNTVLGGEIVQYDQEFKRSTGETVCFQFSINPVYDRTLITGICITGRDITKHKEAEEKVKKSEADYRSLFDNNPQPLWIYDPETFKFLEVNKAAMRLYDYTREEFLSMTLYDIRTKDYFEDLENDIKSSRKSNSYSKGFWQHIKKNGDAIFVEISAMPLVYHNKNARLVLINDITQAKSTEAALLRSEEQAKDSEQRYRTLFEQNLIGVYQSALSGEIKSCNDAFAKMLKYDTTEELMNINATKLNFSSGERNNFINTVTGNKKIYNYEGILRCRDGSPLYVIENISLRKDAATGEELCDGIIIDITERKLAEIKLKESNERFTHLSRTTFDVVWDWDIKTKRLFLGEGFKELFGYAHNNNTVEFSTWADHIHPEDRERVVQNRLNKVINHDKSSWSDDYRYLRADGSVAYILDRGILLRNKTGTYRMIGAMQDVTEQRRLEELVELEKIIKQKEITEAVIAAQENERSEIGRELHDNVNQLLGATKLYIGMAKINEEKREELLNSASGFTVDAIEEIRKLSKTLITPSIRDIGLADSVKDLAEEVMMVYPVKIQVHADDFAEELSDKFCLNVFRIIQEQVNNILKHAKAENIAIYIEDNFGKVLLSVTDDGIGFDTSKRKPGVGLGNIQSRSELYNGRLQLNSRPGHGTTLSIIFDKKDLL